MCMVNSDEFEQSMENMIIQRRFCLIGKREKKWMAAKTVIQTKYENKSTEIDENDYIVQYSGNFNVYIK